MPWVFAIRCAARRWPTPMKGATGGSTRELAHRLSPGAQAVQRRDLGLDLATLSMHSIPRPSIFALQFSVGAFPHNQGAVKMHTLLDLRGNIRALSMYRMASSTMSTARPPAPGSWRDLCHGSRLCRFRPASWLHLAGAFFVTRAKSNMTPIASIRRRPTARRGVICDQTMHSMATTPVAAIPNICGDPLSRFRNRKTLVVSDQSLHSSGLTIAALYKIAGTWSCFFKWIKQHLRINILRNLGKRGEDPNLESPSRLCPRRIIKKRLGLDASLYTLLQFFRYPLREIELKQALAENPTNLYFANN